MSGQPPRVVVLCQVSPSTVARRTAQKGWAPRSENLRCASRRSSLVCRVDWSAQVVVEVLVVRSLAPQALGRLLD
jgi:hypothetical protein